MITNRLLINFIIQEIKKKDKEDFDKIEITNEIILLIKEKFKTELTYDEVVYVINLYLLNPKSKINFKFNKKKYKEVDSVLAKIPSATVTEKFGLIERKPRYVDLGQSYIIYTKKLGPTGYIDVEYTITKDELRKIYELYCGKNTLEIKQICMEMNITSAKFYAIKTAFSITHKSVPHPDEDILNVDHEELAERTVESEQKKFLHTLEKRELRSLRTQVNNFLSEEYKRDQLIKNTMEYIKDIDFTKGISIPKKYNNKESTKVLEIPIFDFHLGKLAWSGETHFSNYDHKIAEERFMWVIDYILDRVKHYEFEKIWFPVGSDFFNFDNRTGSTERGTQQDNDLRHPKMFERGYELYVKAINKLAQKAPVEAFLIQGNHDTLTSHAVCFALKQGFRNNPNVTIDVTPTSRKYKDYGINLIGFAHGDKERARIALNMQDEVPALWGKSLYREWHLGHLHSESIKNYGSLKVRHLSSLTEADSFHSVFGYVGSIAETQVFIWDKENGLHEIIPAIIKR